MDAEHVPASVDGYPESTFLPGNQVQYVYPNNQEAGTLWYHDHALGITRLNVMMGLAGFYLMRDAGEIALGLPSGEYEIPLAIQARSFNSNGSFKYPSPWQDHFFGDTILVNGKAWPYLNVKQGKYRFRILNGSNSRTYTLSLSDPNVPLTFIGTTGGLLPSPADVSQFTFGPGERVDIVIDFAGQSAGTEILLLSSAPAPYPGTPGVGVIPGILKFIVTAGAGFTGALPGALRPVTPIDPNEAVHVRDFVLRKQSEPCAGPMWTINGLHWSDITEYPDLDTVEI